MELPTESPPERIYINNAVITFARDDCCLVLESSEFRTRYYSKQYRIPVEWLPTLLGMARQYQQTKIQYGHEIIPMSERKTFVSLVTYNSMDFNKPGVWINNVSADGYFVFASIPELEAMLRFASLHVPNVVKVAQQETINLFTGRK